MPQSREQGVFSASVGTHEAGNTQYRRMSLPKVVPLGKENNFIVIQPNMQEHSEERAVAEAVNQLVYYVSVKEVMEQNRHLMEELELFQQECWHSQAEKTLRTPQQNRTECDDNTGIVSSTCNKALQQCFNQHIQTLTEKLKAQEHHRALSSLSPLPPNPPDRDPRLKRIAQGKSAVLKASKSVDVLVSSESEEAREAKRSTSPAEQRRFSYPIPIVSLDVQNDPLAHRIHELILLQNETVVKERKSSLLDKRLSKPSLSMPAM